MISFRDRIVRRETLFKPISLIYTPIRLLRQSKKRNSLAKEEIIKLNDENRNNSIWIFGEPVHNNLGDLAQWFCIKKWFEEHYPMYNVRYYTTELGLSNVMIEWLNENIMRGDVVAFQSGYCSHERHLDHKMHLYITRIIKNNAIVYFPQTVNIYSRKAIRESRKIIESNHKVLFLARDRVSYNMAKTLFPNTKVKCYPDIVTMLIGTRGGNNTRNGVLMCLRNDHEKLYTESQIRLLRYNIKRIAPIVRVRDTNSPYELTYTKENIEEIINQTIDEFEKYELVITDRYHGTIFALIANTPVIVIKTNDHKVSSAVDWFDGKYEKNAIQFAESLDEVCNMTKEIITNKVRVINSDVLKREYYSNRLELMI